MYASLGLRHPPRSAQFFSAIYKYVKFIIFTLFVIASEFLRSLLGSAMSTVCYLRSFSFLEILSFSQIDGRVQQFSVLFSVLPELRLNIFKELLDPMMDSLLNIPIRSNFSVALEEDSELVVFYFF